MPARPPTDGEKPSESLITLADLAQSAGAAVMRIYAQDFEVRRKSDDSPVTEADEAAERLILEGLKKLTPEIPVVSEEASEAGHRPDRKVLRFWLVDPLDGTKEFVKRSGEFTVNIALVEGGMPVMGVVFAPAVNQMFIGGAGGAWKRDDDGSWRRIACRSVPAEGLTIMASRSHGDPEKIAAYLKGRKIAHQVNSGSSLKICRIAEGVADVYPRFGPTSEWDTAAGHAVLLGAGGRIETLDGQPLRYGKDSILNPDFVAWGLGG